MDAQDRDPDVIAGFAKGLAVIECFGRERERLTIADVSKLTGLERATARRCLITLARQGYAEFDGKFFRLTPRVLRLGYGYLSATPLPRIVQAGLEALSARLGESCSAAILEGAEIVYVARATQQRVMSIGLSVGSRLPAFCSAMGRVLLAALPGPERRALLEASPRPALTPRTVTDPDALLAILDQVGRQGHALVDQELEIGLKSLAVPVLDRHGAVRAAMNVGVQAASVANERLIAEHLPALAAARDRLAPLIA